MMHLVRFFVAIGVAVILFTVNVMHRSRRAPYFTSPSTERRADIR
ncbi:hypothetical protein [Agromyces sp. NPDC058064]